MTYPNDHDLPMRETIDDILAVVLSIMMLVLLIGENCV